MPSVNVDGAGKQRVFIYPGDSFVGKNLTAAFEERGYDVLTACTGDGDPLSKNTSYKIGSEGASTIEKQFLRFADVVVLELTGHEAAARQVAVEMAKQPFGGKQQTLIAVSDILVWATTSRRMPPHQEPELAAANEPESGLDGGASTTSVAPAPVPVPVPEPLTEQDMDRRSPCLAGAATHEVETAVLRAARKGRLNTHVVCPGLLYGGGEGDATFHSLFKECWEATAEKPPPKIYGAGANRMPMLHVSDLARYVAQVAAAPAGQLPQYMLVADEGHQTQAEVVQALSSFLGTGEVRHVPNDQLLFLPGLDRSTLDLTLSATPLPGYEPAFREGFLSHLAAVVEEYRQERHVAPLRIIMRGAPMSGKSALAARLARLYNLRHITARDIVEAAGKAPPELQRAVQAELSSKEPRVSAKNMSSLLQCLLAADDVRNRGYVLDAFPKNMASAKYAFMKVVPLTPLELAQKEKDEASLMRGSTPGKDVKGKAAAKAKEPKAGKGVPAPEGPEVPEGHKLAPDPDFAPTHVIELSAEDSELKMRLKAVEASEIEAVRAAAAAAAAAAPPVKGGAGKEKMGAVGGHNNDKDYLRRVDMCNKVKAEEAEDLLTKVTAVQHLWGLQEVELEEARKREEAEASTLKAKRRRARMEAIAAASGPVDLTASLGDTRSLASTSAVAVAAGEASPDAAQGPAGPKLPEHGGVTGLLVLDCGARMLRLANPNVESGVLVRGGAGEDGKPTAVRLPEAEEALKAFLGTPHNFEGFLPDEELSSRQLARENTEQRFSREHAAVLNQLNQEMADLTAEAQKLARQAHLQGMGFTSEPLRDWLMSLLMPVISEGLSVIARDRPTDPVRVLANRLLEEAEKLEATYVDPYSNPTYEIQIAKIKAKEKRDSERAAAEAAKEEREMTAKLAAKAKAEAERLAAEAEARLPPRTPPEKQEDA